MMAARNHFEVLGLAPTFFIDRADLEARYRDRQRHTHPDRFSRAPASERAEVLRRATDLNDAYRVLKSDMRRAEYLLLLHGIDLREETEQAGGVRRTLSPMFLADVLELREALQDARHANDEAAIAAVARDIAGRMEEENRRLAAGFAQLEGALSAGAQADEKAGAQASPEVLATLADALLRQRYYQRFVDEISAHEEASH